MAATIALACAAPSHAQTNSGGSWHFVSNPSLNPPSVAITTNSPGTAPGYVFLAPNASGKTMLGRAATLADVGAVAAFVASDRARTMTASTVNISCGALVD